MMRELYILKFNLFTTDFIQLIYIDYYNKI
jgi:hypothetical protein